MAETLRPTPDQGCRLTAPGLSLARLLVCGLRWQKKPGQLTGLNPLKEEDGEDKINRQLGRDYLTPSDVFQG